MDVGNVPPRKDDDSQSSVDKDIFELDTRDIELSSSNNTPFNNRGSVIKDIAESIDVSVDAGLASLPNDGKKEIITESKSNYKADKLSDKSNFSTVKPSSTEEHNLSLINLTTTNTYQCVHDGDDTSSVRFLHLADVNVIEPINDELLESPNKTIKIKTELNDDLDDVRRLSSSKTYARTSAKFSIDLLDDGLVAKTEIDIDEGSCSSGDICQQMEANDDDDELMAAKLESGASENLEQEIMVDPSKRYSAFLAHELANSPHHLLPFQYGWTREVVLRAESANKKSNVHYFSPTGKKMRTRPQIEKYLIENKIDNITSRNFIFAKLKLNSPHDSVRRAVKRATSADTNNISTKSNVVPLHEGRPSNKKHKSNPVTTHLKDSFKKSIASVVINEALEIVRRCTNLCPGQEGIIPSLHCNKCLCLFHPGCVGISDSFAGSSNFTCQECGGDVGVDSLNIRTNFPISEDHLNFGKLKRPLCGSAEPISASISITPVSTLSTNDHPLNPNTNLQHRLLNPAECTSLEGTPKNLIADIVPSLGSSSFPLLKNAILKYTAPMKPPVASRNLRNEHQFAAKPCDAQRVDTLKFGQPQWLPLVSKPVQQCSTKTGHSYKCIPRSTIKRQPIAYSSITALNCGILSLISIFRYLEVPDLLRASEVCLGWNILARHPALWEKTILKNVKIKDWKAFLVAAKRLGVRYLDTREMVVNDNFKDFIGAINGLTNLEGLRLGMSPLKVADAAVNCLPHLKCFSAEWITDSNKNQLFKSGVFVTIDIDKFAAMSQLESLRLRGLNGLRLPPSNTCLERLGSLKNLSCLAMTSMKHMSSAQFEFLFILSNLKTLELGECVNWKEGVYAAISRMKKLQSLRLEFGGEYAERGIQTILPALLNLVKLELIIFSIPSNFGDLLSPLKKLQQLTVWPDLKCRAEQNNFFTLKATKQVTYLKIMIWGLVTSRLTDPKLDLPGQIDHNSVCVPFMGSDPRSPSKMLISAHDLIRKLRKELPLSKVQVIMVPNELYSTMCYMPR